MRQLLRGWEKFAILVFFYLGNVKIWPKNVQIICTGPIWPFQSSIWCTIEAFKTNFLRVITQKCKRSWDYNHVSMYGPITAQPVFQVWNLLRCILCCDWTSKNLNQSSIGHTSNPWTFCIFKTTISGLILQRILKTTVSTLVYVSFWKHVFKVKKKPFFHIFPIRWRSPLLIFKVKLAGLQTPPIDKTPQTYGRCLTSVFLSSSIKYLWNLSLRISYWRTGWLWT